ncbi:transposase [Streptomyces sp. NPDC059909]|uniref:transposase n=1 Tax=Streptomyces sp. NPDC059909 TaxID=3346998 RepID=UPI00365F27D3
MARTGIAWRYLPHDLPPHPTVYGYFKAWEADGTTEQIHDTLRDQLRAKKVRPPGRPRRSSVPRRSGPPGRHAAGADPGPATRTRSLAWLQSGICFSAVARTRRWSATVLVPALPSRNSIE